MIKKKFKRSKIALFIAWHVVCWIRLHRFDIYLVHPEYSPDLCRTSSLHRNRFHRLSNNSLHQRNISKEENRSSQFAR